MATKKTSKMSKMDEEEAKINFMYGLGWMKDNGDEAGLAKAKKAHPDIYADWEKRHAKIEAARKAKKK